MLIRCTACKGGKKLMGMGMIYKTCHACKGAGVVEQPTITIAKPREVLPTEPNDVIFKSEDKELKKIFPGNNETEENKRPTLVIKDVKIEAKPTSNKESNSNGKERKRK